MTEYLTFETRIAPMVWGDKTYTILPIPPEIDAALRAAGARRVEGEIGDHPVNLALATAPAVEGSFCWAGKSLLARIGATPGAAVEVRLRPAPDDAVEVPGDVAAALRGAGLTAAWEALSPGRRRAWLYRIDSAKRPGTRARRIAELTGALSPDA